jgi:hypothetical protein
MEKVKCRNCGREFKVYASELADGKGVYCSRACYNEARARRSKARLDVTVSQSARALVEAQAETESTTLSAVVEEALGVYRDSLVECLECGAQFMPAESGQCMCPACIGAEQDWHEEWCERRAGGMPV